MTKELMNDRLLTDIVNGALDSPDQLYNLDEELKNLPPAIKKTLTAESPEYIDPQETKKINNQFSLVYEEIFREHPEEGMEYLAVQTYLNTNKTNDTEASSTEIYEILINDNTDIYY